MNCPSCHTPLEQTARFCGVCGYRLSPGLPGNAADGTGPARAAPVMNPSAPRAAVSPSSPQARAPSSSQAPPQRAPSHAQAPAAARAPAPQGAQAQAQARSPQRPPTLPRREPTGDEIYLNQVLNNRFRVESKIGEGGFGAVYRGVQLATGRKVALKLLHPEMTKDENLVARFRREGMVLCNLRDAHTITTYDFDRTPDGTLYIAMELLEGKSLHQVFHEEAPLAWKRVFKILTEMCSSLAEAHTGGIVHRDLKPENIYLESRPGNPEFVKILDFGIAKVMRGDTIDPQSPQLTATGQTLGTLEYMSPEQLMGKQLDGRSDVYALGVLAYEMITGRLPFPDAKGPAGLITAQLKQTPMAPSQAYPKAALPAAADRVILKCLEKDKNNRFPDVTALAAALQEAIAGHAAEPEAPKPSRARAPSAPIATHEPRRAEPPIAASPPMVPSAPLPPPPALPPPNPLTSTLPGAGAVSASAPAAAADRGSGLAMLPRPMTPTPPPPAMMPPLAPGLAPPAPPFGYAPHGPGPHAPQGLAPLLPPMAPGLAPQGRPPTPMPLGSHPAGGSQVHAAASSRKLVWWVLALLVVGAGVGTVLALALGR